MKRLGVLILALVCAIGLCSCRVRTTRPRPGEGEGSARETAAGLSSGEDSLEGASGAESAGEPSADARRQENPQAQRKEYDETAAAEIDPARERSIRAPGEEEGLGEAGSPEDASAAHLREDADLPARQLVAAEHAQNKGVSEEAAMADSALTYYSVLLEERAASLFECKRLSVYWETARDRVTVYRSSMEHELILRAGAYDVSARLLEENLQVDDGWVVRKNPGVIVKIVPSGAIERGAEGQRAALAGREEWETVDAVRSGRILLLSEEILSKEWLRTAAALAVARTAYPDLYADVDLDEALRLLSREATGSDPQETYYYYTDQGGTK